MAIPVARVDANPSSTWLLLGGTGHRNALPLCIEARAATLRRRESAIGAVGNVWLYRRCAAAARKEGLVETAKAQESLRAERTRLRGLLQESNEAHGQDALAEIAVGDDVDDADALAAENLEDAVAEQLRTRLAAVERALARIDAGTYGLSVLSGATIPMERLKADPAAELTIEEESAKSD